MSSPLLQIQNLHVGFQTHGKKVSVVLGNTLSVNKGELHALVGESGSGKTVTSIAVMGLLPMPPAVVEKGRIEFLGSNLLSLSPEQMRSLRGNEISMVFQEPARYLNPAFTIGEQIREMLILHLKMTREAAAEKVIQTLHRVGLKDAKRVAKNYPHELSGGMKQRAMIGMAICCNPSLLIADEPTTALDVTTQQRILSLLMDIKHKNNMGILFISHDLSIVRDISDRVSVIYAGRIVESAPRESFFKTPLHPYSRLLLACIPDQTKRGTRLPTVKGSVPNPEDLPKGCTFHPRCPLARSICRTLQPEMEAHQPGHLSSCHFAGEEWNY